MRRINRKGFTLIEVIVVAGIIAILAGILVPMIFKEIDESRITRASADIRSISSALFVFRKDTAQWPILDASQACDPTKPFDVIGSDGNYPTNYVAQGFGPNGGGFNDMLPIDDGCYSNWKGPYIARITADPWSNAYMMNSKDFATVGAPVWIISAGPDGQLQTSNADATVSGDDVGLRLQ
ncbi:MAG: hypothetical protein A2X59_12550 [Nitrospirae bacterium GWC2_42_7]|nr:MAG: hypothetical protein A2X59_12550 [Nitrospirae bacterium GWC2_42_7]